MSNNLRMRMQVSMRTLCLLIAVCAIGLPTAIKQGRRHLVYSRYVTSIHDRDLILVRWSQGKLSRDEVQIAYQQAQDNINDRLNSVYRYCRDYDLTSARMASDHAAYMKKR